MTNYNIQGYEKTNFLLKCMQTNKVNRNGNHNSNNNNTNGKINYLLNCDNFLNEDKIETILVPRYNKWIDIYKFDDAN